MGVCTPAVSDADRRAIEGLTGRGVDAGHLNALVASAVSAALARFQDNDLAGARAILTAEPDEVVLNGRSQGRPRPKQILAGLVMVMFLLFLFSGVLRW